MGKLPVVSGAQAVRAFQRAGWRKERQRGSHVVMLKMGGTLPACQFPNIVNSHRARCDR